MLPTLALFFNGTLFLLMSFYPKYLPFCLLNVIACYAIDQKTKPHNNFVLSCLKNTFGVKILIVYGWFYKYNWSLWKTNWVIGLFWCISVLIGYLVLYLVYR
jgi:hypothetical protein